VERTGDPVRLDASGATTWLEAVVSTPRRVLVGAVDPTARSPYLVSTGVVLAGGLVLPCVPQAAQRYEEERREIAPPPPPAVSPPPAQLTASATPAPTHHQTPAPAAESAPAIVDLTRLEGPATGSNVMAGRSAWMDPTPVAKAFPESKPEARPVQRSEEPAPSRPLPPGSPGPGAPNPFAAPPVPPAPSAAPAPPAAPSAPAESPSPGMPPRPMPAPRPEERRAEESQPAPSATVAPSAPAPAPTPTPVPTAAPTADRDDEDAPPPPGPSPADLPSLDPPSVPVSLPSLSRPAAVFAPPVERLGDDDDDEDDAGGKVVASPSGLPVRVRGQSMPVDLRGALNGTYRENTPPRQPERPGFERPAFERPSFERSPFERQGQVQDRPDEPFRRPNFDPPLIETRAEPGDAEARDSDPGSHGQGNGTGRGDSVIQLPRRPSPPGSSGDDRPQPPGAGVSAPSPIRPGIVPPSGPRPIPPATDRPDASDPGGGSVSPPLPAFFRGTRVARTEGGGTDDADAPADESVSPSAVPPSPVSPSAVPNPVSPSDAPAPAGPATPIGGAPRVPGVLRAVGNDETGAEAGAGDADPVREPPRLLGVWCDAGHVTSPDHSECRVCGLAVPPQAPILVARPPLGELVFDNGERVTVDRPIILGRDPKPVSSPDPDQPLLHPVHSSTGQVSRTHAEVRAVGWDVVVTDLDAMNGTTVTLPGGEPQPLEAGMVTVISAGSRVDLGGETGFVLEVDG
jgi:hypothetical protein